MNRFSRITAAQLADIKRVSTDVHRPAAHRRSFGEQLLRPLLDSKLVPIRWLASDDNSVLAPRRMFLLVTRSTR